MSLPPEIVAELVSSMYPPTGVWRDYQHDFDYYQVLKMLVSLNKLKTSDLPPEPNPADYSDTNSPKTRP